MRPYAAYAPPIGDPPAIQFVGVDRMAADPAYQRPINTRASVSLINAIARDWDWRLCAPLLVAARDDGLFVIDGQHRLAAARLRGDIPHLPAVVVRFASVAEEAMVFVRANRRRKSMSVYDDHRAAVAAGDERAVLVDRLIREAGLTPANKALGQGMAPGEIGCITVINTAIRKYGVPVVAAALNVMGDAFAGQLLSRASALFMGLVFVFARHPETDPDELAVVMGGMTAEEWSSHPMLEGEHSGMGRNEAMRRAILDEIAQGADA